MARAPQLRGTPTAGSGDAVGAQTRRSSRVARPDLLPIADSPMHALAADMAGLAQRSAGAARVVADGARSVRDATRLGLAADASGQASERQADKYLLEQDQEEARDDALDDQAGLMKTGLLLGVASLVANTGLDIYKMAHAQKVQEDGVRVARAEGAYRVTVSEGMAALNPLDPDYDQQVGDLLAQSREAAETGANLTTDEGKFALSAKLDKAGVDSLVKITQQRQKALQSEAKLTYETAAAQALNEITASPSSFDNIVKRFAEQVGPVLGAMAPLDRQRQAEQFARDAVKNRALGMADTGDFDGASKFLVRNAGSMNPVVVRSTLEQIANKERQHVNDWKRSTSEFAGSLKLAIASGAADASDVVDAVKAGKLQDGQAATLLDYADVRARRQRADQERTGSAFSRYSAGMPLSGKQQDTVFSGLLQQGMNSATKAKGGEPLNGFEAENVAVAAATQMVIATGSAPPVVKARISAAERSGSPEALASAAYTVAKLRAADPDGKVPTGAGLVTDLVLEVARGLSGGEPTRETIGIAAQQVLERQGTAADFEARRKGAVSAFKPSPAAKTLEKATGMTDAAAVAQFDRERQRAYIMDGNVDRANAVAADRVKEKFRPTAIGGAMRTVNGPAPEDVVPKLMREALGDDGTRTAIEDAVKAQLLQIEDGPWKGKDFDWKTDQYGTPAYTLAPDDQSAKERAAGTPVSFRVKVRSARYPGVLEDVMIAGPEGHATALRWTAPASDEDALVQVPALSDRLKQERTILTDTRRRFSTPPTSAAPTLGSAAGQAADNAEADEQRAADFDRATDDVIVDNLMGNRAPSFSERIMQSGPKR